MADWPADIAVPVTISTASKYVALSAQELGTVSMSFGSNAWGTANLALFVPIAIPFRYPVRKIFAYNMATVNGNLDVGIYSEDLVKVYSTGSTAQAGTSAPQFLPAAGTVDLVLDPGLYYFALVSSSTTATFAQATFGGVANRYRYAGNFEQLSALPLPATATPAAAATVLRVPLIGITSLASPVF